MLIDTSFLIALVKEDDRFHEEARAVSLYREAATITTEVWTEFLIVVGRALPPERLREIAKRILDGPFFVQAAHDPQDLVDVAADYFAREPDIRARIKRTLSWVDFLLCRTSARQGEAILAYDEGIRDAVRAKFFPGARIA